MNIKRSCMLGILLAFSGAASLVQANEVRLIAITQPVVVAYCVAHKNQNTPLLLDHCRSEVINHAIKVSVNLNGYQYAGVQIMAVDGHSLPANTNQFDQPFQCSMVTDRNKINGAIEITSEPHKITCETKGGIFD